MPFLEPLPNALNTVQEINLPTLRQSNQGRSSDARTTMRTNRAMTIADDGRDLVRRDKSPAFLPSAAPEWEVEVSDGIQKLVCEHSSAFMEFDIKTKPDNVLSELVNASMTTNLIAQIKEGIRMNFHKKTITPDKKTFTAFLQTQTTVRQRELLYEQLEIAFDGIVLNNDIRMCIVTNVVPRLYMRILSKGNSVDAKKIKQKLEHILEIKTPF